jgi:hypothetical protein
MNQSVLSAAELRAAALELMQQPADLNSSVRQEDMALEGAAPVTPESLQEQVSEALLERKLGEVLRLARTRMGFTGTEAGARLGIGRARVSRMEHEAENLGLGAITRYATALGYKVRLELIPEHGGESLIADLG